MVLKEQEAVFVLPRSRRSSTLDRARALSGTHVLRCEELFPPTFLQRHTTFRSFSELLDSAGLPVISKDHPPAEQQRLRAEWGNFLRGSTSFPDWPSMRRAGVMAWTRARLVEKSAGATSIPEPRRLPAGIEDWERPWVDEDEDAFDEDSVLDWAAQKKEKPYTVAFYAALLASEVNRSEIPEDWAITIHHTKDQKLRKFFNLYDGLDIDKADYLRLIPRRVHDQISGMQKSYYAQPLVKEALKEGAKDPAMWKVFRKKYLDPFEAQIEKQFEGYMVKASGGRESVLQQIKTVNANLDTILPLEKGKRIEGSRFKLFQAENLAYRLDFFKTIEKLKDFAALAAVILGGVATMKKIYEGKTNPTSDQALALARFVGQFERTMKQLEEGEGLTQGIMVHFKDRFYEFLKSIDINIEKDVPQVAVAFEYWVSQLPNA